jgi:nucleoside-diphosphate-sugar epimerase
MSMNVLVTGGAGFIGSYLVSRLLDLGADVTVFDLADQPESLAPIASRIRYVRGDLGVAADLYRAVLEHRPTDIFHLGSLLAGPCEADPVRGFRVNFGSTQTLLDAALASGVKRLMMPSSISVFGRDVAEPVVDSAVKNPETVYGQTKLASEHLMLWYARRHGLDCRALRLTWVYGPGRTTGITALYSSRILDAIATGEEITVPNPDERGDWLYVDDAVDALVTLWQANSAPQRVYNIAGGVHAIRDVVAVARELRPDARVNLVEGGANQSPYPAAYDDSLLREEIGWQPRLSLRDAVKKHLEQVASNRSGG